MRMFDIETPQDRDAGQYVWYRYQKQFLMGTIVLGAGVVVAIISWNFILPPAAFPEGEVITVSEDVPVSTIAEELAAANVIRSAAGFKVIVRLTDNERSLASGIYVFDRSLDLFGVIGRLARGEHGITPIRVTLTEGMSIREMAARLETEVPAFDTATFIELASTSEGYLFPDTYFLLPNVTPEDVFDLLRARFDERIATIEEELASSTRSADELVIMASLLEKEAQTFEDKRIIAGILWNRLDADMRLQVDAVFGYIHGRNGYAPTLADLEIDSPYNTYLYEGLPPGPISNPGLESLIAAATPIETEYVYYLTGRDGMMYYARTFAEHKKNRVLHLD